MAEGLGKVRCRRGSDGELRWYLDFGRPGQLYSARGTRFKDRAMAEHFLASIPVQVAEGLDAERAIERLMPEASRAHRVERWVALSRDHAHAHGHGRALAELPSRARALGEAERPLRLVDLLFITDRAPAEHADDVPYTAGRSRSIAFGSATIEFGQDLSWDELVKENTATQRVNPVQLKLGPTTELGRFRPRRLKFSSLRMACDVYPPWSRRTNRRKHQLQAEIARRLAVARRKELVLFVARLPHQLRARRADNGRTVPTNTRRRS